MDRGDILAIVADVIRAQFDAPSLDVPESSTVEDYPDWDSVAQVQILVEIEQRFGIRFVADEFSEIAAIRDLVDRIAEKLPVTQGQADA